MISTILSVLEWDLETSWFRYLWVCTDRDANTNRKLVRSLRMSQKRKHTLENMRSDHNNPILLTLQKRVSMYEEALANGQQAVVTVKLHQTCSGIFRDWSHLLPFILHNVSPNKHPVIKCPLNLCFPEDPLTTPACTGMIRCTQSTGPGRNCGDGGRNTSPLGCF